MRGPPFSEQDAREAVCNALCWSDALRALGYRPVGHNIRTLQRYARCWKIATDHFDPHAVRQRSNRRRRLPLEELLVKGAPFDRGCLKQRLYEEGLRERRCERCGTNEIWNGRPMSLVLDHINGDSTDNRLENLQIVCPNCAATLETHCGRNLPRRRACPRCGGVFAPRGIRHRYCSRSCASASSQLGLARPDSRKVERPPYEQLREEVEQLGYSGTGRKYGVSDVAIRKWLRSYETHASNSGA